MSNLTKTNTNKEILISNLKNKTNKISTLLKQELIDLKIREQELLIESRRSFSMDQEMAVQQLNYTRKRILMLETLSHSPFFAKVVYNSNQEEKSLYISKYELIDEDIISWTAPIAELRFESLGTNQVNLPENKDEHIELKQKDNYVINDDKIIYYSQETKGNGVEIIYEDFLSNIKSEYGLSEIISKIEKEQYKIIQSEYNIPLIVSGPAGSGKTTICLHRISYLLQTPETSDRYSGQNMLMLVQDKSTKDYFSSILPKLGIANMYVYTFFEWGLSVLDIEDSLEETNLYNIDEQYLKLLHNKIDIINKNKIPKKKFGDNILKVLDDLYSKNLNIEYYRIFKNNLTNKKLDYLDITIMLSIMSIDNELYREEETHKSLGGGKYKLKKNKRTIDYGMVLVDEFQNYSSDQIKLIQKVVNTKNNSIVYIGDINQKSLLKPESNLHKELFDKCKKITLDKVYRNTKNILAYIQKQGYNITIPNQARNGEDVEEVCIKNKIDLYDQISKIILKNKNTLSPQTLGILFDDETIKNEAKEDLKDELNSNIKIMTKIESQGTEFNTVISVNSLNLEEIKKQNYSDEFIQMKILSQKNSNYVAYTRAVEKLVVLNLKV